MRDCFPPLLTTEPLKAPPEASAHSAGQKRDQEQHQRNKKHDFCNPNRRSGYTAETEHSRNERDNQQRNDETQHLHAPLNYLSSRQLATRPAVPTMKPIHGLLFLRHNPQLHAARYCLMPKSMPLLEPVRVPND
jgi:hypothetical protein